MVVTMPHVIGNVLEWFPHAGHLASLSRLLYCCTCCTAVLVHLVHIEFAVLVQQYSQYICTRIGQRLLYAVLAVLL